MPVKTETLIESYVECNTNDLDPHENIKIRGSETLPKEKKKRKLSKREIFHISKKNK